MRTCSVVVLFLVAASGCARCGGPAVDEASITRLTAPAPGESPVDHPFVVFTRRSLVIDRIGVPIAAPVSIGSQPSPATMRSEDPSIVAIDGGGRLIGTRNGRTRIGTLHGEGSTLMVEVHAVDAIAVVPPRADLPPGGSAEFVAVDATSGQRLDPALVTWEALPIGRVAVDGGVVRALDKLGRATVWARYGGSTANCEIEVHATGTAISVTPMLARARVGQVLAFSAVGTEAPRWRTTNAGVVTPLRDGLFLARAEGRAKVCAAAGQTACSTVEVAR